MIVWLQKQIKMVHENLQLLIQVVCKSCFFEGVAETERKIQKSGLLGKYASKPTTKDWNQYLGFLTNSSVLKLKIIEIHISDIFTDCKNKKKIMQWLMGGMTFIEL